MIAVTQAPRRDKRTSPGFWRASYPYGHGEVVRFALCPLEAAAAVLEAVAGLETGRMNMIRFLREHSTPKAHTAAMVG